MKKVLAATLVLYFYLFMGASLAAEVTCFGPKQYVRTPGKPNLYTDNFQASSGSARIVVSNGDDDGDSRISSARIMLNGAQIFGPGDFNQHVANLSAEIQLEAVNTLKVWLKSNPKKSHKHSHKNKLNAHPGKSKHGFHRIKNMMNRFWAFCGFGPHPTPAKHDRPYLTITITQETASPTATLSVEPQTITSGQPATLTWRCNDAETCTLEPGIGQVDLSGSTVISPAETTTYILTATNAAGSVTDSATLTVHEPPTAQISIDPQTLVAGQTATLSWNTANADTVSIDPNIGSVAASGSTTVSPSETTTYTITASGPGGTATADTTVAVTYPAPTVSISATPVTITRGEPLTLAWNSSNADLCIIEPDIGAVPVSGSRPVSPDQDTIYVITATGPGGTTTAQIAVTVLSPPPTVTLQASPSTITSGEFATLTWSSDLATSAVIDHGVGTVPVNGSVTVLPVETTIFAITVTGPGGTTTAGTTVTVNVPAPTAALSADPGSILDGGAATLTWACVHADSVTLEPGFGNVDETGSVSVSPAETTTYTITATNASGAATDSATVTVHHAPTAQIAVDPASITAGESATLSWNTTYAESVTIEPDIGAVGSNGSLSISPTQNTTYVITATGPGGAATSSVALSVTDATAPPQLSLSPASITIAYGDSTVLSWTSSEATSAYIDNGVGSVATSGSVTVTPERTTIYTLTVTGPTGSASAQAQVHVSADTEPQPEGTFGQMYNDQIPSDATIGYYDEKRFALVVGKVVDAEGQPIEEVLIGIFKHPEYGTASTNVEGQFTLPVEGGGLVTVVYQKHGLITSHRQVIVPRNDFAIADTVTMLAEDPASTTVTFDGNPETIVTHRSTPFTDEFGTRSATLVFTGDNQAYLTDENGNAVQALDTITTRATVYPTPESMPAVLPPISGFTYCVELAVDGVQRVKFSKPVITWVENYLGFDVGEIVPVGYYDRDKGVWVPSDNGVVVLLLDTNGDGTVDAVDADADGQPDDLDADGTYSSEVVGLEDSARYASGATFWRVAVTHFTPWDTNWPYAPPQDAGQPNPSSAPNASLQKEDDCNGCYNSFVEERSRIFHEDIAIPGTNFTLHYASNRVEGYKTFINVPASGETVPASLKRIIVKVLIAGRTLEQTLAPLPYQSAGLLWDGLDCLGNEMQGAMVAHINIGFVYDAVYYGSDRLAEQAFAQAGDIITGIRAEQQVTVWKNSQLIVTRYNGKDNLAQGWTVSSHHQLHKDVNTSVLLKGDGSFSEAKTNNFITTVAGIGDASAYGFSGDGGPAVKAQLFGPVGLALDSSGNLFISDNGNQRIRKVDPTGIITTVAGNGSAGFGGDGGSAVEAQLSWPGPITVDASGNLYIADTQNFRIRKVDPSGIITTVAGDGSYGFGGDGGPAIQAQLTPNGVAVDSFGNLFISDQANHRVRKVDPNGIITTVVGTGEADYGGDGGPAVKATLASPAGLAVDSSGNLYISDSGNHCIRKVDPSGIITTVAGIGGVGGDGGDGGPAVEALLDSPVSIAIDTTGNLYISDSLNNRIRRVGQTGIISALAGNGWAGFSGDGGPAAEARLDQPASVAMDNIGNLYIAGHINNCVRKVALIPELFISPITDGHIAFSEESGVGHVMSDIGLHISTIDLNTGVALYNFSYDQENKLVSITDQFGNQVTIERSGGEVPTAIISPDGLRIELNIDSDDNLLGVIYPDGGRYDFEYTADGLLTAKIDPNGNYFRNGYDTQGRLTTISDDEGGLWQYSKTVEANGDILVQKLSAEGNLTQYLDHNDIAGTYNSDIIGPAGDHTIYSRSSDGFEVQKTLGCGTSLSLQYVLDPEYKFEYMKQATETTPSGLNQLTLYEKSYVDTNADSLPDQITEKVTVNGKVATVLTDTLQSSKLATSPEGRSVTTLFDHDTLLTTSISIPGLFDKGLNYDTKGRVISISSNVRQTVYTWDSSGNLASVTDPLVKTTNYTYDAVGRVTGMQRPDGGWIGFAYDPNGNMTILTNPVDVDHTFTFNKVNLRSGYQTPISGSYSYVYDRDRKLIQTNFPSGKQINNIYTATQLTQIQTPEGNIDLTYSCGSKVESISKGGESIEYAYDGKLLTGVTLGGTLNQTLGYSYNDDFEITEMTYAGGTEDFIYDRDGLLIGAGGFTITRDADNGFPESVSGNGLTISRTFNGYGELDEQSVAVGSQTAMQWTLTRDNAGRIVAKTETAGGETHSYAYNYDAIGRLLTVTRDEALVESYNYELSGTRISETNTLRGITSRSLSYSDEDHLLTAGNAVYSYDLDGFLTNKTDNGQETTYTYSSRGELIEVQLPDGRIVSYDHDPMGRRIAKRINGAIVEKYLWQDLTRLLAVFDGSDNLTQRFEYADGRMPVAMTQGGGTYILAYDQVGSLRIVADLSGNVVKRIDYDTFGNILNDTNDALIVPFGFAGGLHDRDTGIVRFGHRDYDPDTGRWTAKDPIGFSGGDADLYGYVLNNPVNWVDPYGLFNLKAFSRGLVLVGSGIVGIAAGASMSGTGVGAIIGVPTVIAGVGTFAGGVVQTIVGAFEAPCEDQAIPPGSLTGAAVLASGGSMSDAYRADAIVDVMLAGANLSVALSATNPNLYNMSRVEVVGQAAKTAAEAVTGTVSPTINLSASEK